MTLRKLISETIGYYILMYLLILLMIPLDWRPPLITLSGIVIAFSFLIALFQLLLGDPGWSCLNTIRRRVLTGALILLTILVILGFGIDRIPTEIMDILRAG